MEKKQKDKQTNRQTKKKNKKKKKISWIRGFIQFLFIPNIAQFSFVLKKNRKKKKKKRKRKGKGKGKKMAMEKEKKKKKESNGIAILCATSLFQSLLPTSYPMNNKEAFFFLQESGPKNTI